MGLLNDELPFILNYDITYYVDAASGNDSNDGLTIQTPVLTFQQALNNASNYPRLRKRIILMRLPAGKKEYPISSNIDINVPNVFIDFGGASIQLNADIDTIRIDSNFVVLFNFSIDESFKPKLSPSNALEITGDYIVIFNGTIQNAYGYGIKVSGDRVYRHITKVGILNCSSGLYIGGISYFGTLVDSCLFIDNSVAIINDFSNTVYARNLFLQNIIDYHEEYAQPIIVFSGGPGIAIVNDTAASGLLKNFTFIDSQSRRYKIIDNYPLDFNSGIIFISSADIFGNRIDPVPSLGSGFFVYPQQIPLLSNNFWDRLVNLSYHPTGDSNRDGILDSVSGFYPDIGIGDNKCLNPDIKPINLEGFYAFELPIHNSFTDLSIFNTSLNDNVNFIKSAINIPERNIVSGMISQIDRQLLHTKLTTELIYESGSKFVKQTRIKIPEDNNA
ncbi:MAG: hypothetical protein QXP66_00805 [Candidatus Aenigmatarchaeota archaeon]